MGKKYIIELESGTHIFVLGPEGIVHIGEPDVVYETVDGMQIGDAVINAKPYTAPDLEQVNAEKDKIYDEARARGYEEGKARGYQEGLFDAWEAARKIAHMSYDEEEKVLGSGGWVFIEKHTASEAIEKIKAWEDGKQKINVGDEVEAVYGKAVVIEILGNNKSVIYMYHNASTGVSGIDKVTKTGRHFTEIDSVLEKMRGEQDG